MGRPPNVSYLEISALSWFKLEKYDRLSFIDNRAWAKLLFDRYSLAKMVALNDIGTDSALACFAKLQEDPLSELGFNMQLENSSPVRLLTVGQVVMLRNELDKLISNKVDPLQPVDICLSQDHLSIATAHLHIDLSATNEQIRSSFAEWLDATRREIPQTDGLSNNLRNEIKSWCQVDLLPFHDLLFFAELHGKRIKQADLTELLARYRTDSLGNTSTLQPNLKKLKLLDSRTFDERFVLAFHKQVHHIDC